MKMDQIKYKKEISIGLLAAVILLLIYFGVLRGTDGQLVEENSVSLETLVGETSEPLGEGEMENQEAVQSQPELLQEKVDIVVDVKGAVNQPGVFAFTSDQRVIDAINAAGGLMENADTKHINFAQLLKDEMYVYIPAEGEELTQISGVLEENQTKDPRIDINKAEESEFLLLDGIGPSKAAEIIKYREENGPFKTIDELTNVTGIGEKTLDRIKEKLIVE